MPIIELNNVSKGFGEGLDKVNILNNISLDVEDGEFVAIVGFSGSGKSTLINLMSGLDFPDTGEVLFDGKPVEGPGPERAVCFQSYSLMPWMTVRENVQLAVNSVFPKESKKDRAARADKYIEMVSLGHAKDRRPAELSGGMRQRVAVARSLAMDPKVLLLDEPLSALDALTRANLQDEITDIWSNDKKTVVLITNDVDEAILLADRIIPLNPGPDATFGPSFKVDLPRPRDRTEMNHNDAFKTLRRDVTAYLMDVGVAKKRAEIERPLPDVTPITFGKPKAYTKAAQTSGVAEHRFLEYSQVDKVYPTPKGPLTVVDGFDIKIKKGEFVSVIGHSGCGKSTVLTMTAGLNEVSRGGIILDNKEVSAAGPDRAVVFQAPSLFPWLTAKQNVAVGVDRVYPDATQAEREQVVEYYLSKVGLGDAMDKLGADMSNGMRQRVGIARAFALSPKLLLLDEPFGMLDSLTRWELQEVLMEVWQRTQVTAMCVTHDVDEAILLSDRIIMMTNGPNARIGKVLEVDLPRPRTRKALLEHPDYYAYREQVLSFLEEYEGGANPTPPGEEQPAGDTTSDVASEAAA
ncbi:nitrate ABC transporter ATP-binding protein [Ponticaulis sp.]|uniref:ABC transporter ATP-binding protein n=1 Tax=Ponticaulis sp. TaxID=2020902 RepID=UPI000C47AF41|nr:nitrate ABC transporter ATP-binding protein [Ponticaulis sp.]MAJ07377.1 nitrate/sulfonate/bicarbonate ABC transporter ATP-binding protein [Ponticaulis sp.]MAJ08102.1 nitrate/sulfonate/bicarbonate ABC transporter ATP-binding protein [Ponticaulis sp.]|tara:strand:- start:43793 stop:45523 length:1731 start_codon:yes stop_codon:yes gene_type:complete